jgi:tetratricopeptide (TPR) repeat protein
VSLPVPDEKEPPVQSIQLGPPRVETSTAEMKLPDGWGAELPEATHAHSAYVNLDQTYRFEKGVLYSQRKVEVLVEKVPVADWKAYKKWTDAANVGNEQYVQLTRAKADAGEEKPKKNEEVAKAEAGPLTARESNERAGKLVTDAYTALQNKDRKSAEAMLDEAKGLNPKQPFLWSTYGDAALQRGEMTEAATDDEKELTLHPEEFTVYGDLQRLYGLLNRKEDQVGVLRRWVAADPSDPGAVVALTQELGV